MRVHYHTFGCKANQYDTERMRQEAEARGALTVEEREEADVFVVNTCTVTNQADADARRYVRRLHRERPGARVIVAGCSAALKGAAYREMPAVAGVVAGHDPVEVSLALGALRFTQIEVGTPLDRLDTEPVGGELLRNRRGAARGWLKVQDGCDRKCAFCATRLARGTSRSRSPGEVVAEARLLAQTHREIVITGVHIGHYGHDLIPAAELSTLCARLLTEVPGVRFRLGSIEATEVDDLLIDLLADSGGWLAPHLHMPLQSGADPVLRRMRRWHTREQYLDRAREIAGRIAPLGLGADVITGFPGETDEDHAATRALIDDLPFTYLHVFPFSPRDDTVAAGLPDPVPQRVAGERARELRELAHDKGHAHRSARVGGRARIVLEGTGGTGLTEDYLRVGVVGPADGAGPDLFEARRVPGKGSEQPNPVDMPGIVSGTLLGDGDDLYIDAPTPLPRIQA